ncbi:MAG: glycosyltransferase family 2 protein [Flavobacteriia bacterium]|jgi:glycosyltransferase involved in cell wall biosynthesis
MKFSIIIPTYNRAHIVEKTLKSVFNQTYKNYEIIVVDNCSTDRTIEVLKPYADNQQIRLIQHDVNYERSTSRNTGMKNASGDYLTFLDSDDIMGENCLQDAADFIDEHKEFQIFHNRYKYRDMEGNIIEMYQPKINLAKSFEAILELNFLACIGVFISKTIYQRYRFTENKDIIGSEDWLFWIEILKDYKPIGRIEKVNSFIIEHDGRTMRDFKPELLEKRVHLIREILTDRLKIGNKIKIYDWSSGILVANGYYEAGNKKRAFSKLMNTGLKFPLIIFKLRTLILMKNIIFR